MRCAGLFLPFLFIVSIGLASAKAENICPDALGEGQSIAVPSDKNVRVMFYVRGPEPGYIEICKIRSGQKQLLYAAVAKTQLWYQAIYIHNDGKPFDLKNYSAWIQRSVAHPWTGMRRHVTDEGYVFKWFESSEDASPNVTIEICVERDLEKCPSHNVTGSANNLAHMSEYARKRWLFRWAHRHGLTASPPQ